MSIRVHDLAKHCGLSSKEMMAKLKAMNYPVKSVSSTVDNITAESIEKEYGYVLTAPEPPAPLPVPPPAPPPLPPVAPKMSRLLPSRYHRRKLSAHAHCQNRSFLRRQPHHHGHGQRLNLLFNSQQYRRNR